MGTHAYALLAVEKETFAEVKQLLMAAGYEHAFDTDDGQEIMDMNGLALVEKTDETP